MDNYYGNICYCRRCNGVVHTIKKGDTLYLISKYYKVPIGEIMNANRNINIYNLQIGDEICIPVRRPEAGNQLDMGESNNMPNLQMDYDTENMNNVNNMRNINGVDEMRGRSNMTMTPDMDINDDMSFMSAEKSGDYPDKNARLSDFLEKEDMTIGEFVKFMRKFDNE